MPIARFTLTAFQLAVVEHLVGGPITAESLESLLSGAVQFDASREPEPRWAAPRPASRRITPNRSDALLDAVIEPSSGGAIALAQGDTIRIEQVADGQGVDLSVHELAGRQRRLSAGRTRAMHGIHPTVGATLFSTPPEVPLLRIVADTAPSHDLLFPACTPLEYEQLTGLTGHASCQRDPRRAGGNVVAPSGTRLDDVLNLWLPTAVDPLGMLRWWPTWCRRGDRIDLRAERDVLVILSTCPDDLFGSSQYAPSPVRVIVRGRDRAGSGTRREATLPGRHDRRHEVEVNLSPTVRRHIDSSSRTAGSATRAARSQSACPPSLRSARGKASTAPARAGRALAPPHDGVTAGRRRPPRVSAAPGVVPRSSMPGSAASSQIASNGQRKVQFAPTARLTWA